jgi:hypothetical protein
MVAGRRNSDCSAKTFGSYWRPKVVFGSSITKLPEVVTAEAVNGTA